MTGTLHYLLELRRHLLRYLLVLAIVFIALAIYSKTIFEWLVWPVLTHLTAAQPLIATTVTSPLMVPLLAAVWLAFYITFPVAVWESWRFVSPALYRRERSWGRGMVLLGSGLFYLGSAFAYWVVLPLVFNFVLQVAPSAVAVRPDIGHYFRFFLQLCVAFGLCFEVPIVTVILALTGWVSLSTLGRSRPVVLIGAFVLGMVLTPPDILSQLLLAGPIYLLYEFGMLLARYVLAQRSQPESLQK